jgi:ankyrin repeat protein
LPASLKYVNFSSFESYSLLRPTLLYSNDRGSNLLPTYQRLLVQRLKVSDIKKDTPPASAALKLSAEQKYPLCKLLDGREIAIVGEQKVDGDGNCGFRSILGPIYARVNPGLMTRAGVITFLTDGMKDESIRHLISKDVLAKYQEYVANVWAMEKDQKFPATLQTNFKQLKEAAKKDDSAAYQKSQEKKVEDYCQSKEAIQAYLGDYLKYDDVWPHVQGSLAAFAQMLGIRTHCLQKQIDSTYRHVDIPQTAIEYKEEVFLSQNVTRTHFNRLAVNMTSQPNQQSQNVATSKTEKTSTAITEKQDAKTSTLPPPSAIPYHCQLAIHYLVEHQQKFKAEENLTDIKKRYIQPLTFWCHDLALYAGLILLNDEGLITSWPELFEAFIDKKVLSPSFVESLKNVWTDLQQLRLQQYLTTDLKLPSDRLAHINRVLHSMYYLLKTDTQQATLSLHHIEEQSLLEQRKFSLEQQHIKKQILLEQLTTPFPASKDTCDGQFQLEWLTPTGERMHRLIARSLQDHWLQQGWIDAKGIFQEKARTATDGRGIVLPIIALAFPENKAASSMEPPPVAYLKVFPEMPGRQSLAETLAWRISGYGSMSTLCRLSCIDSKQSYPVLISQYAGETLQVLYRKGTLTNEEKKLDRKSFTLKVLETLILMYEDDKLDNLALLFTSLNGETSGRLISFDCDRVLVEPLLIRNGLFTTETKVNSKSVVFCMPQMQLPLDTDAVQEFCRLDPIAVLTDWLQELERYSRTVYSSSTSNSLFSTDEINNWRKRSQDSCYVPVVFASGTLRSIYQNWLRLRSILQSNELPANHMVLVRCLEPHFASFYEKTFSLPAATDTEKRFKTLPTDYVIIEEKEKKSSPSKAPNHSTPIKLNHQQSALSEQLHSWKSVAIPGDKQDIKEAIQRNEIYHPSQALQELKDIHRLQKDLDTTCLDLLRGNKESFQKLKDADHLKELVIKKIRFGTLSDQIQRFILQELAGGNYRELYLSDCKVLNHRTLAPILEKSSNLRHLEAENCVSLNREALQILAKRCEHLEDLNIAGAVEIRRVINASIGNFTTNPLVFLHLKRLKVKHCPALQVIDINAPQLEDLSLEGSNRLSVLKTQSSRFNPFIENLLIRIAKEGHQILQERDEAGNTPLLQATKNNDNVAVQWLLQNGAALGIDVKDRAYGFTSLMWAAWHDNAQVTQMLLAAKADIESRSNDGGTPLAQAAYHDSITSARILVDANAVLEAKANNGFTPLMWATSKKASRTFQLLIAAKANIDATDMDGQTSMELAMQNDQAQAAKMLITANANLAAKGSFGDTLLTLAAREGHEENITFLLSAKADPNATTTSISKTTPLMQAIMAGKISAVRILIDARADLRIKDADGDTALLYSAYHGHRQVLQLLLEKDATLNNESNLEGTTAILWAAYAGHFHIVDFLLSMSPSQCISAAYGGYLKMLQKQFTNIPPRFSTRNQEGSIALVLAAAKGHLAIVQFIVPHIIDPLEKKSSCEAALLWAAANKHILVVQWLHDTCGISLTIADCMGHTPLLHAAEKNHVNMVNWLLANGSHTNEKNRNGYTALDLVRRNTKTLNELIPFLNKDIYDPETKQLKEWLEKIEAPKRKIEASLETYNVINDCFNHVSINRTIFSYFFTPNPAPIPTPTPSIDTPSVISVAVPAADKKREDTEIFLTAIAMRNNGPS